ncbi:MAG: FmdB family zinc ribbon protein [Verrucomicrobiota bacterium]|nr:FmdB family zinc ribbon protein [Verrucomicrobiota bacterium]|tara:strand:- start:249 stop:500 length:252 start_codon:yes stop_codon:yes gene_type:complete
MPIYEYISKNPKKGCKVCSDGFELNRPIDRAPLENCPICKKPVKKLISNINTPTITKPLSVSDAKSAGFTVLEKRDEGTYEKL